MSEPLSWSALAWSFIPGLGHIKTNRPQLGWIILPIWLVLFVLALLCIGTSWISLAVTGMIAVHTFAVVTLFAAHLAYERLLMRAAFGAVVFLCLRFFVYEPGEWLGTRFWVPVPIDFVDENAIIANGDGLIFEGPWMRPGSFNRGDLVVYEIERFQTRGYVIRSGLGVDRVVGVPGDRIQVNNGTLLINGRAPLKGAEPLGGIARLGDLDTTLRAREYAIFPTLLRPGFFHYVRRNQRLPAELRRRLSVARYDNILGRVVLRLHPLSRFGAVE